MHDGGCLAVTRHSQPERHIATTGYQTLVDAAEIFMRLARDAEAETGMVAARPRCLPALNRHRSRTHLPVDAAVSMEPSAPIKRLANIGSVERVYHAIEPSIGQSHVSVQKNKSVAVWQHIDRKVPQVFFVEQDVRVFVGSVSDSVWHWLRRLTLKRGLRDSDDCASGDDPSERIGEQPFRRLESARREKRHYNPHTVARQNTPPSISFVHAMESDAAE